MKKDKGENKMKPNITFLEVEHQEKKTKTFNVISNHINENIGEISFYGGWRCYIFEPLADTRFSYECMIEIAEFVNKLTKEWKESLIERGIYNGIK